MKKAAFPKYTRMLLIMLVLAVVLAGCKKEPVIDAHQPPIEGQDEINSPSMTEEGGQGELNPEPPASADNGPDDSLPVEPNSPQREPLEPLLINSSFLEDASQGRIAALPFGFGHHHLDVLEELGEPLESGSHNSHYYTYEDWTYFFSEPELTVTAIRIEGSKIMYRMSEIRSILGEPVFEGDAGVGDGWAALYLAGDYELWFEAESRTGLIQSLLYKSQ